MGGMALSGQAQQITDLENGRKDLEMEIQSLRESIKQKQDVTNLMTDRSDTISESVKETEEQIQTTSNNLRLQDMRLEETSRALQTTSNNLRLQDLRLAATSRTLQTTSRTLTTCQGSISSLCQFVSSILNTILIVGYTFLIQYKCSFTYCFCYVPFKANSLNTGLQSLPFPPPVIADNSTMTINGTMTNGTMTNDTMTNSAASVESVNAAFANLTSSIMQLMQNTTSFNTC